MERVTKEATEQIVVRTSGKQIKGKEKRWWNEEVQEAVRKKKKVFKKWTEENGGDEARDRHKEWKKRCKRAVAKSRAELTEEWYRYLDTKDGRNEVYKTTKGRKK